MKTDNIVEEHVSYFDCENIQTERCGYKLIQYRAVDTLGICWPGYQILLVYAPDDCSAEKVSLEKEVIDAQLRTPINLRMERMADLFREYNTCLYKTKLNFIYSQLHLDSERKHSAYLTTRVEELEKAKEKWRLLRMLWRIIFLILAIRWAIRYCKGVTLLRSGIKLCGQLAEK